MISTAERVRHLIIRASAGSGKTYRLSSRYIILLTLGASPESILATTFTRKASGEIFERVLRRLADAAQDEHGAEELSRALSEDLGITVAVTLPAARSMLRRVCDSLHRISISTLDSYFNRVAGCFRLELGLAQEPDILDEKCTAAADLRREAIGAFLQKGSTEENVRLLLSLQRSNASHAVEQPLDKILARLRTIHLESDPRAWAALQPAGTRLPEIELDALNVRLCALPGNKILTGAANKTAAAVQRRNWRQCFSSGPLKSFIDGKDTFSGAALTDSIFSPFWEVREHAAAFFTDALMDQTAATHLLLDRFGREFDRLQRARKILFFSDLPRILGAVLDDDSSELARIIGYRLDGQVRHLLLDEFQDTSPEQWRVLRPMAREIVSEGPHAESGRSFFCVGDIKQAIYGWRGGCAGIFDTIEKDLFMSCSVETIDVSRRSSQVVLDTVDRVFSSLDINPALAAYAPVGERWKRDFPKHIAHHHEMPGYAELITSPSQKDTDDESAKAIHDGFCAQKIFRIAEARPDCTVGVLVRTNATAQNFLSLLRRLGVSCSGESGNPLDIEPAVNLILSALLFADQPGDTASAFHVLTSPLAKMIPLHSLENPHLAAASESLRRRIISDGLAAVISEWAVVLALKCAPSGGYRLERLIEMADAFEPREPLRPSEFVDHVRSTSVEEPSPANVRVMTIHKSKGLEFDIVVLPELSKPMGKFDGPVCVMRERVSGPPTAIFRSGIALERALNSQLKAGFDAEIERRLDDDLAGLYVAMTRPRHALHMMIPPLMKIGGDKFGAAGTTDRSFTTLLRHALSVDIANEDIEGEQILFASGDPNWKMGAAQAGPPAEGGLPLNPVRLAPSDSSRRRSMRRIAPSTLSGSCFPTISSPAIDRGLLMHAWFEQILWIDALPEDSALISLARRAFPRMRETFIKKQLGDFRLSLTKPHVVESLSRPPAGEFQVWREHPFVVNEGGYLSKGQFDRVVVGLDSGHPTRATLVDFKTGDIAQADKYKPQIDFYRRALTKLLRLDASAIEARLLFVEHGVVEIF